MTDAWARAGELWRQMANPRDPEHAGRMADEMDALFARPTPMTPANASEEARAREVLADVMGYRGAQRQSFIDGNMLPILFPEDCFRAMLAFAKPSPDTVSGEVERAARFMRHDGLCGVLGGYGYCTCGMDEAKAALRLASPDALEG